MFLPTWDLEKWKTAAIITVTMGGNGRPAGTIGEEIAMSIKKAFTWISSFHRNESGNQQIGGIMGLAVAALLLIALLAFGQGLLKYVYDSVKKMLGNDKSSEVSEF